MPSFLGHPRSAGILVPAPIYGTWNPAGTSPNVALTNWNLTAEVTGPNAPDAYTLAASGGYDFDLGKRYFEVRVISIGGLASSISIGFADSEPDPGGDELGDLPWGYAFRGDGYKENSGNALAIGSAINAGDILMFAIRAYLEGEISKANVWFGVNGTWFSGGNPATDVNSAFSGAIAQFATDWGVRASLKTNGDKLMANFGGAPFAYVVPSGFSSGWGQHID